MGIMLQTPRTLTKKTLGDRAFLAAAPKLWNGLPAKQIAKLQRLQNSAARLIFKIPSFITSHQFCVRFIGFL